MAKMFLGIALSCGSVCFYTIFGVMAQYFKVHPLDLILCRCAIQSALFSLILIYKREIWRWSAPMIFAGILAFVSNASYIIVIHILPLGPSVILLHSTPGFTALFSRLLAKERISMVKAFCIAFIFIGQILVVQPALIFEEFNCGKSFMGPGQYFGIAIGLLAGSSNALMVVFVALHAPSKDATLFTASILGLVTAMVVGPWLPGSQLFHGSSQNLIEVGCKALIVGFFAVLAFGTWTFSIGHCPSILLAMISSLEVVTAFASQIVILHQKVNILQGFGAIVVFASVIIAVLDDEKNMSKISNITELDEETTPIKPQK